MSSHETQKILELDALDAAQRMEQPLEDWRAAINQQFQAVDIARRVELDAEEEAHANATFVTKTLGLLPHAEKSEQGNHSITCADASTALLLYRTIVWGSSRPFYPIGQVDYRIGKGDLLYVPVPGAEKDAGIQGYQKDAKFYVGPTRSHILPDKKLFASASKREKEKLASMQDKATGMFILTHGRDLGDDPARILSSEWGSYDNTRATYLRRLEDLPREVIGEFNVSRHLSTLMKTLGDAKAFARLTQEWKGMLAPQLEGSEADSVVIDRLAGQMGLAGVIERQSADDTLLDLSKQR